MVRKTSEVLPGFEYFVKGEKPSLLLHAGTHGNEYESIEFITECVKKYEDRLANFIYVPRVSPSAVSLKKRTNKNGLDLNRVFTNLENDMEVRVNRNILEDFKFDLMVSFHEDPESDEYYIYDEGFEFKHSDKIKKHNERLKKLGIKLLNGVDDPADPHLNFEFVEGYRQFKMDHNIENIGMTTTWALSEGKIPEAFVPEIPGKLTLKEKAIIVETFFTDVLL